MSGPLHDGPVVVTGGAGAIGSALVRTLLAQGTEVRVVDNFSTGRREHLPAPGGASRLSVHEADLREPSGYASVFRGASAVWHLAANTDIRRGSADPNVDFEQGTLATFRVLETVRRESVPWLLFSSSSVVYGRAKVLPTPEDYGPMEPESLYGAGKVAAEGMCAAYAHSFGVKVHMFRFANIIGPGMTHGILHDFFEKLARDPTRLEVLGDGRQAKSYLRTEDCVDGMLLGAARSSDPVNVFNLGSHDRLSAGEIARKVVQAHGGRARIEFTGGERGWTGDVPQQQLAVDRIEKLGWRPKYTSAGAIDRTIEEMAAARHIGH